MAVVDGEPWQALLPKAQAAVNEFWRMMDYRPPAMPPEISDAAPDTAQPRTVDRAGVAVTESG
jgi:hypothetical protein